MHFNFSIFCNETFQRSTLSSNEIKLSTEKIYNGCSVYYVYYVNAFAKTPNQNSNELQRPKTTLKKEYIKKKMLAAEKRVEQFS